MESSDSFYISIPTPSTNFMNFIISLCYSALGLYAIYLSFRCNQGSFNIGHFLASVFFAPLYVIYQLANNFENCK